MHHPDALSKLRLRDGAESSNRKKKSKRKKHRAAIPPLFSPGRPPSLCAYIVHLMDSPVYNGAATGEDSSRFRVHNTLFRVPYYLERLIWTGAIACFDAILGLIVASPLRILTRFSRRRPMDSGLLFDCISLCTVMLCVSLHVRLIEPGMLYFGMKDVTAEFLKITLVYVALDVADKILNNIGVDVIAMLLESCTLFTSGQTSFISLALDAALFTATICLHSFVVMSLAMVWYVSMESERAILAFMIISNFGEIKTVVFKRFDPRKLYVMSRMDIVERVNLFLSTLFIVVEDLGQIDQWTFNREIIKNCLAILLLETVVDIVKHSVVVNLNEVRPGIYREYLSEILQAVWNTCTIQKLAFEPFGPTILFLRVVYSASCIGQRSVGMKLLLLSGVFVVLAIVKVITGWGLRWCAWWYLDRDDSGNKQKREADFTRQR